jgi:hypothetical protein
MKVSEDTGKLKKLIEVVIQRLGKGGKLYKAPSTKKKGGQR